MVKCICAILFAACTLFSSAAYALSPDDIIGTWNLVSNVRQAAGSDKIENNLGENPRGVVIITPEHRFIALFTSADRKPATTTEESAALQNSHTAYSGLVTFAPNPADAAGLKMTTKVDIAWNAEWAGTTQVRFLSLAGDRLTIRTPMIKNPYTGQDAVATLVFERAR